MAVEIQSTAETFAADIHVPFVVVGGGACGLTGALAARDGGLDVLVLEADPILGGTTAMSTGLIPACGTLEQSAEGIKDSPEIFAADIAAKTKGRVDHDVVAKLTAESAETVAWLRDVHAVPLTLVDGFTYPGHAVRRMYGTPNRTGSELMAALEAACITAGVNILTGARVETLAADQDGKIAGLRYRRPDGAIDAVSCDAVLLACCGYAGNADMVARYIPEMANATFHGHPGNKGEAIIWGEGLGARLADMAAYQGHGGLAAGHGVPILWPTIMEGGIQVNRAGQRFSNEASGYSEQAVKVLGQLGGVAWSVFDARIHDMMMQFDDFQEAKRCGAVVEAENAHALANACNIDAQGLAATLAEVADMKSSGSRDQYGRDFAGSAQLDGKLYAAKVTGALFHTQGGLEVDGEARVLRSDGMPFANLFAGGGAARGISGPGADGYLAGNGLMTATTLGKLAGRAAVKIPTKQQAA